MSDSKIPEIEPLGPARDAQEPEQERDSDPDPVRVPVQVQVPTEAPLPREPAMAIAAAAPAAPAPAGSQRMRQPMPAARGPNDRGPADRNRRRPIDDRRGGPPDSPEQEIALERIDPHALEVVRRLRRFGHRAYLVGGCVRDLLLGLQPKDHDIATSARPEEVKSIFRNSRIIGRRFRLVHVFFRGGKIIEVSTFRAAAVIADEEGEEGQDLLIRRDNVFGTEEEDARRRDFTCNGLFYDIGQGRIIDHVGGLKDVEARMLRMIGDPDVRLREDPVRILRAIRIAAKAGLQIDPELSSALRRHKADISRCSPARVLEETLRLLRIGHAEKIVRMMEETGVLEFLLPELHSYLEWPRGEGDTDEPPANRILPAMSSRDLMYRHLRALDERIRKTAVSDAVVLGALLYAPVVDIQAEAERENRDKNRAVNEFLVTVGARLTLTRRISEHLRQIFLAQRHFVRTKGGKKKTSPGSLSRRAFFPDALDLYEIHVNAIGQDAVEELERWRGKRAANNDDPTPPPVDGEAAFDAMPAQHGPNAAGGAPKPRRSRRRRGGRNRPRPPAQ